MKSIIGYLLIAIFAGCLVGLLLVRRSHVVDKQTGITREYTALIAHVEKEIAGPSGTPTDATRQSFITYLSATAVVKPGQAVLIQPHIANGKPDPTYLFDVYVGETLIGTYDRQQVEGYFNGRGQAKDIDTTGI